MDRGQQFLTKEMLTPVSSIGWDMNGRLEDMDKLFTHLKADFEVTKGALEEKVDVYKLRGTHSIVQTPKPTT